MVTLSVNGESETSRPGGSSSISWRDRLGTQVSIRTQRKRWTERAETWDRHNDVGMAKVAAKAIELAHVRPGMTCVDLGCGGGRLALLLAKQGAQVIGVDVSNAMIERMVEQAKNDGVSGVTGLAVPIEHFTLPGESVDVVITNYALHHLTDPDKAKVVSAAYGWLRPGGQLIVSDMMLGRGATPRDREVIASKIRIMAKKGIPGYWRILKNAARYLLRVHERPITPEAWSALFRASGFREIEIVNVVAEANVVTGVKPLTPGS